MLLALLGFLTFIGGEREIQVVASVVDAQGNTYVGGDIGGAVNSSGVVNRDIFVSKLDRAGNPLFTETFGGDGQDQLRSMTVDPAGNVVLAGTTTSTRFEGQPPLPSSPFGTSWGFAMKLTPDGRRVVMFAPFGGASGFTSPAAVTADAEGNVYLAGSTSSPGFPTTPGLPRGIVRSGGIAIYGAFVVKLSQEGKVLFAGIFSGEDLGCGTCRVASFISNSANAIALDAQGNIYVGGNALVVDLPTTPDSWQPNGRGAFVAKVNASGKYLDFLTFLTPRGGNITRATLTGMAVDPAGAVYVTGATNSEGAPLVSPTSTITQGYLMKLSPDGKSRLWATVAQPGGATPTGLTRMNGGMLLLTGRKLLPMSPAGLPAGPERDIPQPLLGGMLAEQGQDSRLVTVASVSGLVAQISLDHPLQPGVHALANAAGGPFTGRAAPRQIVVVHGDRIGPANDQAAVPDATGDFPLNLGSTEVWLDDIRLPLLSVSSSRIATVIPSNRFKPGDSATMRIVRGGAELPPFRVAVASSVVEVFRETSGNYAFAVNEDGTTNSRSNPAKRGSVVAIWTTGDSCVGGGPDGRVARVSQNYNCASIITTPGNEAEVLYAGPSPGSVYGLTQLNFRVPADQAGPTGLSILPIQVWPQGKRTESLSFSSPPSVWVTQ